METMLIIMENAAKLLMDTTMYLLQTLINKERGKDVIKLVTNVMIQKKTHALNV